LRRGTGK